MAIVEIVEGHAALALALVVVLLIAVPAALSAVRRRPIDLPWVGVEDGALFGITRAAIKGVTQSKAWLNESYHKYSQKGKSYVLADISGRHEIIIPNNQLRWLTDKPDSVASVAQAHYDLLQCDYAFTDSAMMKILFHEKVIHKHVPRKVDAVIPEIWEETVDCYDETWGHDTVNWKGIPVWDNDMYIISRLSNRLFVGKPLCRDKQFLKFSGAFANDVVLVFVLLPLIPKVLHPIVGRLMSLPNHYHGWRIRQIVMPTILKRIKDMNDLEANPNLKLDIPEDYITWHIRTAKSEGRPEAASPINIAKAVMPIEFAAIHTTSLTMTMVLFDIFSSPPAEHVVEGIREEAERLWKECDGKWNKQTLTKMIRTDSAIRESMRLSNFISRGVPRKVIVKGGLHNEEGGWTAPEGSFIAVDADSRHHDAELYPAPDTYDAFRFSRPREEYEAAHPDGSKSDEYLKMKSLSMISTGENFLAFGHGRHACPGRFFVQHEMKMMLAHIVMNYEVQMLPERPPTQWMGGSVIPPAKAQLLVRRRVRS